jgi:hypothetical protein
MQDLGYSYRSYNFGLGGARGFEILATLKVILDQHPKRLKYAIIDTHMFDTGIPETNRMTWRTIWWHDLRATWVVTRMILDQHEDWEKTFDQIWMHWRHAFVRYTRLGQGGRMFQNWIRPRMPDPVLEAMIARRGYESLDEDFKRDRQRLIGRYEGLRRSRSRFAARREQLARGQTPRLPLDEPTRIGTQLLVENAEQAGVTLIFVASPLIMEKAPSEALHQTGAFPVFFAFNDPSRYPELYEIDNRFDFTHLNENGASLLTTHLADEFAKWLASSGGAR